MTERASDLLTELPTGSQTRLLESGLLAVESVRAIEPELLRTQ